MPTATGSSSTPSLILGPDGNPIRHLKESERFEEIIGSYDGYLANSFRLPPFNPDHWISSRGWRTLEEMMAVGAVRGAVNLIRDAVLYKGWRVIPAVVDQADANYEQANEIACAFTYALENITDEAGNEGDFRQDIWEILYAIHMGFHVAEIQWRILEEGPYKGKLGFKGFSHKPCKQIGFDVDPRTLAVRNITSYTPGDGYDFDIPVAKVLRYTFAPRDSLPYGQGVGRAAYKHSWSLDFLYRFWNICLEVFGSPFILGKAGQGVMKLAQAALQAIRQGAAPVLPLGVEAELIEMTGGGAAAFKAAAEHHSQQIGYIYLYATLTSGEGQRSGSLALGKVHQDQQEYGLGGRRTDLEQVITRQLIRRFVRYNYGPDALALCPRFSLGVWDEQDMQRMATGFQSLITSNVMHPGEPQIRERLGLAPLAPDLREQMEKAWKNIGAQPSTVPSGGQAGQGADNGGGSDDTDD